MTQAHSGQAVHWWLAQRIGADDNGFGGSPAGDGSGSGVSLCQSSTVKTAAEGEKIFKSSTTSMADSQVEEGWCKGPGRRLVAWWPGVLEGTLAIGTGEFVGVRPRACRKAAGNRRDCSGNVTDRPNGWESLVKQSRKGGEAMMGGLSSRLSIKGRPGGVERHRRPQEQIRAPVPGNKAENSPDWLFLLQSADCHAMGCLWHS
ncbi:hypothetical protein IQ07DRAFT_318488 [Pyrenochaeta sp. DS3sAY3a]|nr:hypothetical protein IQ07DRAFT_318488 [Pyrenochaeta sp. DS3sAY3a]